MTEGARGTHNSFVGDRSNYSNGGTHDDSGRSEREVTAALEQCRRMKYPASITNVCSSSCMLLCAALEYIFSNRRTEAPPSKFHNWAPCHARGNAQARISPEDESWCRRYHRQSLACVFPSLALQCFIVELRWRLFRVGGSAELSSSFPAVPTLHT